MVALFVVFTIVVFFLVDLLTQIRESRHSQIKQDMFYTEGLGYTMADGGEKISTAKQKKLT